MAIQLTQILSEIKILPNKIPLSSVKTLVIRWLKENQKGFWNLEGIEKVIEECESVDNIVDNLPGGMMKAYFILLSAIIDESK